jgi:ATP-binding cassette subfamily B protein
MKRLQVFGLIMSEFARVLSAGRKLFLLAWVQYWRLITVTGVVVMVASIAPFAQNWAMGRFIDQLVKATKTGDREIYWPLLYGAIAIGACYAMANCLQFFLKSTLYREMFKSTSTDVNEKIANLEIQLHEDPACKDLITTVLEKAMWHAPDFMQRTTYLLQNAIEISIASIIFIHADPIAGVVITGFTLPRLVLEIIYNHELWKTEKNIAEVRRKFWYARGVLVELRSLTETKLYQNVSFFVRRIGYLLGVIKDQELKAERRNVKRQLVALAATELAAAWVLLRFVGNVIDGAMEIGTLTFYIASMINFRFALNSLCQNVGSQFRDGKFVTDMFEAFDLKHKNAAVTQATVPVPKRIEEIRFEKVQFAYPGTDRNVLQDISLTLHRGETFGLVAENGSGKTTLVKLLCRLYDPTQGRILVNGIDIRCFSLYEWQSAIGVLLQEYGHYEHLTVRTAIALGREPDGIVDERQVVRAAQAAGAHDFIMELPLQYDTTLGRAFKDGVELSGGQYQRLAIARIFYRNAAISIFDEPTSAIDGAAESLIFEEIFDGMTDAIKILITHRFSTLRRANTICVLKDGRIHESGTHQELMELNGLYAERYVEQASSYH